MNGHTWWWKTRRKKGLAAERSLRAKGITRSEMRKLKAMVEADPLGEWVEPKEGEATITFLGPKATRAWRELRASETHEGVSGDQGDQN